MGRKNFKRCSLIFSFYTIYDIYDNFSDPDAWGKPPSNIFWGNLKWNGAFAMCNSIPGAHYCLADMYILGNSVSKI